MSEDVLNVAVVGAGYWGRNLVRSFATAPRCLLRYVCDLNAEVLAGQKSLRNQGIPVSPEEF